MAIISWVQFFAYFVSNKSASSWSARWYHDTSLCIGSYPCWQTAKAYRYRISIGYYITVESYSGKYAASSTAAYTIRNRKRRYWRYG